MNYYYCYNTYKKITDVLNLGKNVEKPGVILSSPDLVGPQLTGLIGISDGCGITQAAAIKKVLNEWNLFEAVIVYCLI